MEDERSFAEELGASIDADLEFAQANRLAGEVRDLAVALRAWDFDFGDMHADAVVEVARPLMVALADRGYQHAQRIKLFGPMGGSPREAVNEAAGRYLGGTLEEQAQLLADSVAAAMAGPFIQDGGQSVDEALESFWPIMQETLGGEARFDAPARAAFQFGAVLYAVETTLVFQMLRDRRYAEGAAAIKKDEQRARRRFWRRER